MRRKTVPSGTVFSCLKDGMDSFESFVRYSETDINGKLHIGKAVDYFQDVAIRQTDDLGVGGEYLKARSLSWVLSTWNIEILRLPRRGEKIVTETIPYDVKGFLGKRNFRMTDEQGELLLCADSLWTMLNIETLKPAKVPEEVISRYGVHEKIPMTYFRSRIVLPGSWDEKMPVRVTPSFLDDNRHVNNARYVMAALDSLEDWDPGRDYRRIRVEYHAQALLGDELIPRVGENESGRVVTLVSSDGTGTYCVVSFERK